MTFLVIAIIIIILYGQDVYHFRGFFTGRNPYINLGDPIYGGIYRLLCYAVSVIISLSIIYIVPKGYTFFTKLGSRTLQVYFLHLLILSWYHEYNMNDYIIHVFSSCWKTMYILIFIILTFVLSIKIFEYPFKSIMNMKLKKIFIENEFE